MRDGVRWGVMIGVEGGNKELTYLLNSLLPIKSVSDELLTFHSPHISPLNNAN